MAKKIIFTSEYKEDNVVNTKEIKYDSDGHYIADKEKYYQKASDIIFFRELEKETLLVVGPTKIVWESLLAINTFELVEY